MRERVRVIGAGLCVGLGVLAGLAQSASAQSFTIGTQPVVSGLTRPVAVTAPNGDLARLFILEQRVSGVGRIRVVNLPSNTLNAAFYLSISGLATGNEQGLLGLAFHPNFMNNGYFYVYYNRSPETGISTAAWWKRPS